MNQMNYSPRLFVVSSLSALLGLAACGGSGTEEPSVGKDAAASDPPLPTLAVNGTISAAGRNVVPSYGAATIKKSGTAGVVISDAAMGCAALTAEYTSHSMPRPGTYMAVALPSFDKGIAENHLVQFTVVPPLGFSLGGGGSNAGTVEVLEASDTAVTVRIDYRDALKEGEYTVNGEFTVTRCP